MPVAGVAHYPSHIHLPEPQLSRIDVKHVRPDYRFKIRFIHVEQGLQVERRLFDHHSLIHRFDFGFPWVIPGTDVLAAVAAIDPQSHWDSHFHGGDFS